jgi:uroporphyrinogen decarboxylase
MVEIDKFSLLEAVFKQEKTEKVPYALWKHFIEADKTPEGLAKAQLEFQQEYNSDFMKISPHGSYCVVDFGGILGEYRPISGSRICERPPIITLNDWESLEPVDPNDGEFGNQIKAVELIHREVENLVPTIMTIFSPFMVASKLDPSLLEHLHQDPELVKGQIEMLTKLMREFSESSLDAGADGLFLATQHFNSQLKLEDIQQYEFKPIKFLIETAGRKSTINVLHLHGEKPYFRLATEFPDIQAINWHDQRTDPNLIEARQDFKGGLLGGLNEMEEIRTGTKEEIHDSITNVYKKFDGRGLVFTPGCVLPIDVSEENISQIVDTIQAFLPI